MPSEDRRDSSGGRDPPPRAGPSSPSMSSPQGSSAEQTDRPRKSSVASSSASNPPPPPPSDFNPRPDLSFEEPLHGIQPPTDLQDPFATAGSLSRPPSSATSSNAVPSAPSSASPTDPTFTSTALPPDVPPIPFPQRPQIRAIQRLSSESVCRSRALSGTSSTHSSDSGEILAARRDELVSHILSDSGDSSRRTSTASSSPGSESIEPNVNVISPTPSPSILNTADQVPARTDVESSFGAEEWMRSRERAGSADELAHAWDSVVSHTE